MGRGCTLLGCTPRSAHMRSASVSRIDPLSTCTCTHTTTAGQASEVVYMLAFCAKLHWVFVTRLLTLSGLLSPGSWLLKKSINHDTCTTKVSEIRHMGPYPRAPLF